MASIKQSLIAPAMMKQEDTKESSEWNALMKQREEAHRQHVKASAGQADQAVAAEKEVHASTLEEMEAKIKALKKAEGHEEPEEPKEAPKHEHHTAESNEKVEEDILPESLQKALNHHNYE